MCRSPGDDHRLLSTVHPDDQYSSSITIRYWRGHDTSSCVRDASKLPRLVAKNATRKVKNRKVPHQHFYTVYNVNYILKSAFLQCFENGFPRYFNMVYKRYSSVFVIFLNFLFRYFLLVCNIFKFIIHIINIYTYLYNIL